MKTAEEWAQKIMWNVYWTPKIAADLVRRIQEDVLKAAAREAKGGCYTANEYGCGPECAAGCVHIVDLIPASTAS